MNIDTHEKIFRSAGVRDELIRASWPGLKCYIITWVLSLGPKGPLSRTQRSYSVRAPVSHTVES